MSPTGLPWNTRQSRVWLRNQSRGTISALYAHRPRTGRPSPENERTIP